MKKIILIILLLIIGLSGGVLFEKELNVSQIVFNSNMDMNSNEHAGHSNSESKEKKIMYWVAPMNPTYRRDEPGKSPMGMDLIPVYEGEDEGMDEDMSIVKISPEVVNNLGVRSANVERGPLWKRIGTVGYIDYDETRINHIHTRTEGWIERLQVRAEGEEVKRGQLLFELYSPPLVNAQEEYLQALASGNRLLAAASKEKLSALGISKSQIDRLEKDKKITQNIRFYATQSGVLINLGVREGMYIKPETQILSIANLDTIWLLAEVFERQADWVEVGQSAEAKLPSMPGVIWKGTVEYIYPDLDPVTRTLRVRLRFDNSKEKLKPNMYSHVTIFTGEKKDVISIPRGALIRDAHQERVIKALGEGRFQAQDVVSGIESGDMIEIISGLNEDDKIVISSQFLIDSESNLKASLNRMQAVEDDMSEHSMEHDEMEKE
ncbi:MAG: efflux RND transporter periplasmic adaptor subunit [Proteobacteria bacterium]|nr:efflux RND transporter periplasmic adaptor subunit [Pseudomonadota bacterium]NOG60344.1 efflux RND transporter periplasmic adaptor subunit [Pseudomonadota bacterium]